MKYNRHLGKKPHSVVFVLLLPNFLQFQTVDQLFSVVSHGEELNYLFVVKSVNQTDEEDSAETITRKRMIRMWTNFVKFG